MRLSLLVLLSTSAPLVPQHFFGSGGHVLVTAHATPDATRSVLAITTSKSAMRLMPLSPFLYSITSAPSWQRSPAPPPFFSTLLLPSFRRGAELVSPTLLINATTVASTRC